MSEITVTNKQIQLFTAVGRNYISSIGSKHNPLSYAIQRMIDKVKRPLEEYNAKAQDLRAEHALIKDSAFVSNAKGETEIDPVKAKKFNDAMRKLEMEEVTIKDRYLATQLPVDIEQIWFEHLVPFVIADFIEPSTTPANATKEELT